jgi:hypothetical protein
MHAEEEYGVNPREMPHFSENSYVFVVFDLREMGLWLGVTLVYPGVTYERNLRKERNQIPQIFNFKKGCLWHLSPRDWGCMPHP